VSAPAEEYALELQGVTKRFDGVVAVDALDLAVRNGEFLSLLGPSGCGKTTTLRLIAGFERPEEGVVRIGGQPVGTLPPYKRPVNTVFQTYALFPHLNVLDNVAYGLKQRGLDRRERRAQALAALERVQLPQVADRRPRQLSGGQQQRVALARALVMKPKVLLLDEPLGALDLRVRKRLQILLKQIQQEVGITFVYVTHDQEEALAMSDRVAVMNDGRIEQLGKPREIYDMPATRFVADFIGETNFVTHRGQTVALRPERVRISRDGATAPDGLSGKVVAAMVIGPAIQCLVRTDDGQEVLVRQQRSEAGDTDETLHEGDRVTLTWAADAALALKEEKEEEVGA
jgi:ABC-type Fe3+/spermidine/putrescine transport system ATPase subunit